MSRVQRKGSDTTVRGREIDMETGEAPNLSVSAVQASTTAATVAGAPALPGQNGATILRIYTYKSPQLASFVFALTIGTNGLILILWAYLFFGGK